MKASSNKRFLSLILALVLVLSVMPLHVLAVEYLNTTVLDGKVQVSTDGISGQGSAVLNDDGTITVTSVATASCSGSAFSFEANDHTVWVTNNTADETLMVSFDYAATGLGTLTIDGVNKTDFPEGSCSKSLAPGESVTVVLTSPATGTSTGATGTGDAASVVLSNFALQDTGAKNITVVKTEGGSVTVNGEALTADSVTAEVDFVTGMALTATADAGYAFLGWVNAETMEVISTLPQFLFQPLADTMVGAAFVADDDQTYWLANGTLHTDLNTAAAAAPQGDRRVVLLKSGTLAAGTYYIPSGVTMLVPYDDAKTGYGSEPEMLPNGASFTAPTPYCTLTMATGAQLVVDGNLELAAKHHVSSGSGSVNYGGAIGSQYGHIATEDGAIIEVNGTLYAWGIVSGEGEVIANSGATVYEKMQINDYRGGTVTTSMATTYADRKLFPFSQYYVQNVEVKETIHAGATLMINAGVYLSAAEQASVAFIGNSGAMFTVAEGSWVTKQYNAEEDRLEIDVYGNTTLGSIGLDFEGNEVNSGSFRLGINNNIDIRIHSGVATIMQEMVLQPGATVTVDREAAIYNVTNLYVMDADDWGTYVKGHTLLPVKWSYLNGTTVKRTTVTDAVVDINGTVINAGQVYSSGSESIISSEKTGVYALLTPALSGDSIYQVTTNDPSANGITAGNGWVQIPFTAAVLVNGDNTAITAEGGQYDAYIYDTALNSWVQKNIFNDGAGYTATVTYDANGGSGTAPSTTVDYFGTAMNFMYSEYTAIAPFAFAAAEGNVSREGYDFLGWSNDASATEPQILAGQSMNVSADTILYAVWDAQSFTLTIDGVGQDVDCGTDLSTLIPQPSKDNMIFNGWTVTDGQGNVIEAPTVMPADDVTFTSNWIACYTLTFLDENGDVIATESYKAGDAISAPDYAPEGYNFLGWVNTASGVIESVPAVMPESDLEYQATVAPITYTITFVNGETEIGEVTVNYGEDAVLLGALTADNAVFQGWGETAETATYEAGQTISISADMTLYAVWHVHSFENGSCTGCGAEDPDYVKPSTVPTITMRYPSLSFEDVIIMNVYYVASNLEDVVEMGLITNTAKPEVVSIENADAVIPGYGIEGSFYFSSTEGIAPKDIGDTIYFAVYAKLADGTVVYTKMIGYSPKTYALNQLTTGSAEMRPLVAAMLNYGSAAQTYFNYKTDALVNATMTDEQKAMAEAYRADMIASVTQASGAKLGSFVNDKTYTQRYPTISFEGAFCINYYFAPSLAVEGDVTMYIWSLEDYEAADVLTKENATKAVKMELAENGEYMAVVDGIAAKDLDKAAYVTFIYNDGTTEHCGGVIAYTIGMYCKSQASKTGTLAELAKACAVYGYYAKQLFNK